MDWQPIETAPMDGTWVILDVEIGGEVFQPLVGRWAPAAFPDLGIYEWQVVDSRPTTIGGKLQTDDLFNHYSDGRVYHWMPLPPPPTGA